MTSAITASVVIVAFHSEDVIAGAIASVPDHCEVIVVEQSLDGASAEVARQLKRTRLTVVLSGANRGFGAGCNLGAAQATSNTLVFMNPDARSTEDAIDTLARRVTDSKGKEVVGPRIRGEGGAFHTRAARATSPLQDLICWFGGEHRVPSRWFHEIPESDPVYSQGGAVSHVQGSFFAIDRRTFFKAGGFDERLFLYGEEASLAYRLRAIGVVEVIEPGAVVEHVGQTSTVKFSDFAVQHKFRSKVLLYKWHLGATRGTLAGAMFLAVAFALKYAFALRDVMGASGRSEGWSLDAVLGGLRAGLLGTEIERPAVPAVEAAWPPAARPVRSARVLNDRGVESSDAGSA